MGQHKVYNVYIFRAIRVLGGQKREGKDKKIIEEIIKFDEKHNLYTQEDQQSPRRISKTGSIRRCDIYTHHKFLKEKRENK